MNTISEIQVSYHPKSSDKPQIKTSQDAYELIKPLYNEDTLQYKEIFMVLYLNRSNRVLGYHEHSIGSDTGTVVSPKQIIGIALKVNASSLILVHNHPSGSTKPSSADIEITKRIKEAAGLFEIQVLDHLIIGDGFYSMADYGIF
ncbi:MAG: DNA repair protein [Saprospiraceae bacterium]|nr:DNA repair protein [Saprospiraceae bacterium]MBK9726908.1 DNA repair protein [Saprospiraceae bacterium]